jgi:hypothetical protein
MAFHVHVTRDHIKQKLKFHLTKLDDAHIDQIADIMDQMNSHHASVIFKSLDGYVYKDHPWVIGDTVMIHKEHLYTHRYDENAMRNHGIIDENGLIECKIIRISKLDDEIRVQYKRVDNDGSHGTTEWSCDVTKIERTVGLERPNLNDLL